ncbi:MAG TPA: hypothetical protein VFK24_01970 [Gammaproteobacteria bacterium]|nr:hypothetical protein [Gammaproteobacteria bacterium]
MAKLAALIMERRHAERFEALKACLRDVVTLRTGCDVEENTYTGRGSLCYLIRVGPDPINSFEQPIKTAGWSGVMCGYYLGRDPNVVASASRSSDSATILFDELSSGGPAELAKADGIFAYARWHTESEILEAGVDKLGMRPLHWSKIDGGYVVASDLKAVIAVQGQPRPNFLAWEERLAFGYALGEHTLVEGAARFSEAEVIAFSATRHRSTAYENFLDSVEIKSYDVDDFLHEQQTLFSQAMSRLANLYAARENTMLTLSGGDDSRRILGWLLDEGIHPEAFTVPEVLADGTEYESEIVSRLCRLAGLRGWKVYPRTAKDRALVRQCRNLLADYQTDDHRFAATLALALGRCEKPNFDGIGGDVAIAALYVRPQYFEQGGEDAFLRDFLPAGENGLLPRLRTDRLRETCRRLLRADDTPNRYTRFILRQRTRRKISLATYACQAGTMESLSPYLDRQVLRQALSLHPREKIGTRLQARLLERFTHNFAGIPTTHATPTELATARTRRFPPIERREERALLRNVVLGSSRVAQWRVRPVQKVRFLAALAVGAQLGEGWLQWETEKANRVQQLTQFYDAIETSDRYMDNVCALGTMLGSRRDFLTPIE